MKFREWKNPNARARDQRVIKEVKEMREFDETEGNVLLLWNRVCEGEKKVWKGNVV